ncbi:24714_t:CDS:2, partial [Dentiscutata erythropus]
RAVVLIPRKRKSQDIEEDKERKKKMSKMHNTRAKSRETKSSSKKEKLALEPSSSICSETDSTSTNWAEILEHENTVYITNVLSTDTKNFATSNKDNSMALSMESSSNISEIRSGDELSHDLQEGATSLNKSTDKKVSTPFAKPWSSLFTKLTKGRATYSTFSSQANINTKNNNALMFDIQCLKDVSINEIVAMLYSKIRTDFIEKYTKEGITMFQQTFYSFISSRHNHSILLVRFRKVPIAMREEISKEIQEKKAPKLCFFYNGEGHLKKDFKQLNATKKLNQHYKQFKENKNKRVETTKTINNKLALEGNTGEERLNENTLVPMDTNMEMKATELSDEAETEQMVIENIYTTKSLIQSKPKNSCIEESVVKQVELRNQNTEVHTSNTKFLTTKGDRPNIAILNPGGSVSKESNDTQKVEYRANQDDEDFTKVKNNKKKKRKIDLGTTNNH